MGAPLDLRHASFARAYEVSIAPLGAGVAYTYGNTAANFAPLRCTFEIERKFSSSADKAKVALYNLRPQTRNAIKQGSTLRLSAGHAGAPDLLFLGSVMKVKTAQNGPDIVTEMELGDGEPTINYAVFSLTVAQPIPLAALLQAIAKSMQLEIGGAVLSVAPGIIKGIPNKNIPAGRVFYGAPKDILTRLLGPLKIDWNVQNGKLVLLPTASPSFASAVILSPSTGLLGVPGLSEKFTTFSALLNAKITPGAYVQLVSANELTRGYVRVATCKYQGDTHDAPWNIECEGTPLKLPLPFVPVAQGSDFMKAVQK